MTVDTTARRTSGTRIISAPAATLFTVLADASLHSVVDGSNMVNGNGGKAEPLSMGSKFSMSMHMAFLPYRITNEVVEFEQDRLIAWRHPGHHIWRWEFEPISEDAESPTTRVTETFDWAPSRSTKMIELVGYPRRHEANIERSLDRLEAYVMHRADSL